VLCASRSSGVPMESGSGTGVTSAA